MRFYEYLGQTSNVGTHLGTARHGQRKDDEPIEGANVKLNFGDCD